MMILYSTVNSAGEICVTPGHFLITVLHIVHSVKKIKLHKASRENFFASRMIYHDCDTTRMNRV